MLIVFFYNRHCAVLVVDEDYSCTVILEEPQAPMISFAGTARWINTHAKLVILNRICFDYGAHDGKKKFLISQRSHVLLLRQHTHNFYLFGCMYAAIHMILDCID